MRIRKTGRILIFISFLAISSIVGHESDGSCGVSSHGHDDEHHHHHLSCDHEHEEEKKGVGFMLPEEIAEEEDMKSDSHLHSHDHSHEVKRSVDAPDLTTLGLWIHAMGCSLLVSMASLVCLIMLPLFILKGKPSKMLVDSLAAFGAGAMLGDSFLHQLPHAFGGGHSHSQDHHADHAHAHEHHHEDGQSHAHSLADLSVGLSVLSGIVLFLLVERLVRYVEGASGNRSGHSHHHHLRNSGSKVKDDGGNSQDQKQMSVEKNENKITDKNLNDANDNKHETPRKRRSAKVNGDKKHNGGSPISSTEIVETKGEENLKQGSDLVFGYLNLFSDGVHNFTDGMALGSAFLLYGSVGGWSRTLFLLAHELPQEVGDFGILVRSGFSVIHALFFNFLSALVALAGTALALILGKDPGHSALIEGFTAGGFIYIAVAGVLPEISSGNSSLKSTALQVVFLVLGMSVALGISLLE